MKRLRTRLLVLILMAVAPALGAIVYTGYIEHRAAYARARQEARALDQNIAQSFRRSMQETSLLVDTLTLVPAVTARTLDECHSFLARVLGRNAYLANIGVIDRTGALVCSAVPFRGTVNLGDRPYYKLARKHGQGAVGTFQIGRIVHVPMIVLAASLPEDAGDGRTVVYASLKLRWMNRIAAGAGLPKGSSLTVLDASRRVIARYPRPDAWLGRRLPSLGALTQGLATGHFAMTTGQGPDGVLRLFSVYAQRGPGAKPEAYVIVGIPHSEIAGAANRALLVSLIMLAAVTVLLVGISWWGSRKLILQRVDTLVSAAEQLGRGEGATRARLEGDDELARLGTAFDAMADSLETHNRELEDQVVRVSRLNRTYRVLSAINGAVLRNRDRDDLLREVCRIAVEVGEHSMAWIGMVLTGTDRVRMVAHAGPCREMIEALYVSTDASRPEGRGTIGTALRTLRPWVCNDIATDPQMSAWRDDLLAIECRAVATFPLFIRDRLFGNFTVYASQVGYFDDDDVRLFEEVAADTALGLELIETGEQRDYLVNFDPVTGLENRQRFLANLEQTLRVLPHDSPSPWVLAMEVPELRRIKDHYGQHVTDEILRRTVPRLKDILEASDSLAVLSRGVFAIALLPGNHARRDMRSVVDAIQALCPCDIEVDGHSHLVSVVIGAATADGHMNADMLVRNAEVALNSLGEAPGRTFQAYSRQHDARETRRYQVRQALRRAIAGNEFEIVYQPYVEVTTGRPVGAEALLRWKDDELGEVSPGEFIPVAEEAGLIGEIGAWVFSRVLRQIKTWQDAGIALGTVSVNVSAVELQQSGVAKLVGEYLSESCIDLRQSPLALELTETAVVQDFERVSSILEEIRQFGVRTYLDDYGTGYSSLLYLLRTPLDVLKIDLSFIRRIVEDPTSLALTRSSISLAHSLHLKVIAEGVENEEQLTVLAGLDCDIAQGFLFSRPLSPGDLVDFLAEHRGIKDA